MKVLFDARMAGWLGVGRYTVGLLTGLAVLSQDGPVRDFEIVSLRNPKDAEWLDAHPGLQGIRWEDCNRRPFSPLDGVLMGRDWRGSADIFHSPHFVLPSGLGMPMISTIHDPIPLLGAAAGYDRSRSWAFWAGTRYACAAAGAVVTTTRATGQWLDDMGLRPKRLVIIPAAVDPTFFQLRSNAEQQEVRRLYRLERDYVLWIGALRPHKNLPLLLDAWNHAGLQESADLLLGGSADTPYGRRVLSRLEHGGAQVQGPRYLGRIPDEQLPALISGAKLLVFPSLYEGFGLPPLEAQACGTPVLASDIPVLREVLGKGAAYFDSRDHRDLAVKLKDLLTSAETLADLRRRGFASAARYSWQATARQMLRLYRSLE